MALIDRCTLPRNKACRDGIGTAAVRGEFDHRLVRSALEAAAQDLTGLRFLGMTASDDVRTAELRDAAGEHRSARFTQAPGVGSMRARTSAR